MRFAAAREKRRNKISKYKEDVIRKERTKIQIPKGKAKRKILDKRGIKII